MFQLPYLSIRYPPIPLPLPEMRCSPSHRVFVGELLEGCADGGDAIENNHDWKKDYSKNDNARHQCILFRTRLPPVHILCFFFYSLFFTLHVSSSQSHDQPSTYTRGLARSASASPHGHRGSHASRHSGGRNRQRRVCKVASGSI